MSPRSSLRKSRLTDCLFQAVTVKTKSSLASILLILHVRVFIASLQAVFLTHLIEKYYNRSMIANVIHENLMPISSISIVRI